MILGSCPKSYRAETHRAVPPEETLARAERSLPAAGITRVADITDLDRIGIPVFSSIRPTALRGAVSVYNGKGATAIEARVSAMMEGIERCCSEPDSREVIRATYAQLVEAGERALHPSVFITAEGADPDGVVSWTRATDLTGGEEVLVPAQAVFHPWPPDGTRIFRTNTNGLASGNTLEEAVFHGLMEVIERDAWSLAEVTRDTGPRLVIDCGGTAQELYDRFTAAGVEVTVKDITSDVGIPTIAAVADDVTLRDPALMTLGMGTHTSPDIALIRALTEVAQSRLTQIHGAREDTTVADFRRSIGYERTRRLNQYWFRSDGERRLSEMTTHDHDDFLDEIHDVITALKRAGLPLVLAADLTRPDIGIPVVRVIVPGLEVFAMDQERRGARCNNATRRRLSRPKP